MEVHEVKIVRYEVDYGDKRSCGSLVIVAETPLGVISVGSDGVGSDDEEVTWCLNDREFNEKAALPDLGVPGYGSGKTAQKRFEAVREIEAKEAIAKLLTDMKEDWLEEE